MTYHLMILIRRAPHISQSTFKRIWETSHVPFIKSLVGSDFPLRQIRNYLEPITGPEEEPRGDASTASTASPANPANPAGIASPASKSDSSLTGVYDAIVELVFTDKAEFQAVSARVSKPEIADRIAEHEEQFVDRSAIRFYVVEEARETRRED